MTAKKKKLPEHPDPRSKTLKLLDKVEEEASQGLDPTDAANDATVRAIRAARRLIENSWTDTRLPEYKVRVFWGTSDAIVRAIGPEEASRVALSVLPQPTATRLVVMKENLDRAWEEVATFNDKTLT